MSLSIKPQNVMCPLAAALLLAILSACNYMFSPFTTGPAAVIGVYDKSNKREAWKRYAEDGDVYAQFELAESLAYGRLEGPVDSREAFRWYCRAALSGYARAQLEVGKIYEGSRKLKDLAVQLDPARAYLWFTLAANRLNEEARQRRDVLRASLPAQTLTEAWAFIENPGFVPCGM